MFPAVFRQASATCSTAFRIADRVIVVNFLISLVGIVCQIPTILITVSLGYQSFYYTPLSWIAGLLLCSLVFGIISYIITLGFSLSIPLLIDNPDMGAIEAMKTSAALMKGNKGRYFYISLSFIGISLFCVYFLSESDISGRSPTCP